MKTHGPLIGVLTHVLIDSEKEGFLHGMEGLLTSLYPYSNNDHPEKAYEIIDVKNDK